MIEKTCLVCKNKFFVIPKQQRMNLDKSQDSYMIKCGYTVLRFWEHDVYKNKDKVKNKIIEVINQ